MTPADTLREDKARVERAINGAPAWSLVLLAIGALTALAGAYGADLGDALVTAARALLPTALVFTLLLLAKSLADFSQTGPSIQDEVLRHYRSYSLWSLLRLAVWAFTLAALMAAAGVLLYGLWCTAVAVPFTLAGALTASVLGLGLIAFYQFCRHLLLIPASLCASLNYLPSRLYPLWKLLSVARLDWIRRLAAAVSGALALAASVPLAQTGDLASLAALWGTVSALAGLSTWVAWDREPGPVRATRDGLPNILMIGSDTLRADRLGAAGYRRSLTPAIDALAARGTQFTHCFVPCARTAPSLVSLLTGTWPHRHGIRDNFVADRDTDLPVPSLPEALQPHGYISGSISDWCGADLGKFPFGFDVLDLPEDQWNLRYLIRQGPKDLRLFLSLFTHNRFGRHFLPEIYYLAGIPLTRQLGRTGRRALSALAQGDRPFFLNLFCATTHPPFGSDYPYYRRYSDAQYDGESKFVMARLTDPFEIIRRQGEAKTEFDLDQIINLYDGCVRSFDDEVGRMLAHLDACGLADNTIVVIYSDHGMEFFEHDTWGQGNSAIGDFSARVPLIVTDPRRPGGRVVDAITRTIDLAPTLLDLADIPAGALSADGVSLRPMVDGLTDDLGLTAYNETGIWLTELPGMLPGHIRYPNLLNLLEVPDKCSGTLAIKPQYRDVLIRAKDRMVRSGRWKLVYQPMDDGPLYRLFDLETDPQCRHDRIAEQPQIAARLIGLLSGCMREDGVGG